MRGSISADCGGLMGWRDQHPACTAPMLPEKRAPQCQKTYTVDKRFDAWSEWKESWAFFEDKITTPPHTFGWKMLLSFFSVKWKDRTRGFQTNIAICLWVSLGRCFQKGLTEEGLSILSVTIPWPGINKIKRRKGAEHSTHFSPPLQCDQLHNAIPCHHASHTMSVSLLRLWIQANPPFLNLPLAAIFSQRWDGS